MMASVFTADQIEAGREYVLANTFQPMPAFRVGQTPYGILPVTSLQLYNESSDFADWLKLHW